MRQPRGSSLTEFLLVITLGALLTGAPQALAQEGSSPATGHTQVVAHGVVSLPSGNVVWRVMVRSAAPAEEITAKTGFLLAERGNVLVVDQPSGHTSLLPPGTALLTRDGARQERSSLGTEATRYYSLELVAATDEADVRDDDVRYIGDPFPSPDGAHSIVLVRDALADGELTEVPSSTGRTLIVATAGTIDVVTLKDETPVRLAAGEAIAMSGAVNVTANRGPASFVAAVIGSEVTLPSAAASTERVDGGSVEVVARECPPDYPGGAREIPDRFAADCREPLPGIRFTLAGAGRETTARTDAAGRFRSEDVLPGDYVLTNDLRGENRRFQVYCINATLGGEATTGRNQFEILMTPGAQVRCAWYVVPASNVATGTLTLSVYVCPTATSPLSECASRFVEGEIAVEGPRGIWLDRGNSDVSQRGDRRWENLPPGRYHLAANLLQVEDPGYAVARVDGADEYFEGVATVELDTAHPDAVLAVVFAPGGPVPVGTG